MAGAQTTQQWCPACGRYVLAVKSTHGARNTAGCLGVFFTLGLSLLLMRGDPYRCPTCGSLTARAPGTPPSRELHAPQIVVLVALSVFCAVAGGSGGGGAIGVLVGAALPWVVAHMIGYRFPQQG